MAERPAVRIDALGYTDAALGAIPLPGGVLELTLGLGSGLARRAGDPPGRVWAIADRGPNLKAPLAVERYGLAHLLPLAAIPGAKIMPRPDVGPGLCELQVAADRVELLRALPLVTPAGRPIGGLPLPGAEEAAMEPAFDLQGRPLGADPNGADSEALVAMADGTFWVAEEYGPSLLKVDADGVVRLRWTPEGVDLPGAACPVAAVLPAAALARRLNRGFEGLALSPDETRLYTALQSPLASPGEPADRIRIWTLDAATGGLLAEHDYRLDAPESFHRDAAAGPVVPADLKVCELVALGEGRLLVLERISHTAKIYAVDLAAPGLRLEKRLLFTTDDAPEVAADIEGVARLSDTELLVVTDNDFGIEGVPTRFYRLTFEVPF